MNYLSDRSKPAVAISADDLRTLLGELGNDNFRRREAAEARLRSIADDIRPILNAARFVEKDAEVRNRIERAVARPGDAIAVTPDLLRHLRAIEILERIGTPAARACLERLAAGNPTSRATEEAMSALSRTTR